MSDLNIHLVSFIGGYIEVLPHMPEHYRLRGFHLFLITPHSVLYGDPVVDRIQQSASSFDARITSVTVVPWSQTVNPLLHALARAHAPNDWFVLADEDEFQTYPDSEVDAIRFRTRRRYDFIEESLVGWVAADDWQ